MNRTLQRPSSPADQPDRRDQVPTRLSECGDTLGIREICGVLGISQRELFRLRQHGCFVDPLPSLPHRWSKVSVQRFLEGSTTIRLHAQKRFGRTA